MINTILEIAKDKDVWVASIFLDGRLRTLGSYDTFPEALACKKLADEYYEDIESRRIK